MATIGMKKRSGTARKRTTGAKRKRVAAGSAATIKVGGVNYTKSGCSRLKTDAKKMAEKARTLGKNARVVKSGTGYCVYTRSRKAA